MYLLFAFSECEGGGGMCDYIGMFESIAKATERLKQESVSLCSFLEGQIVRHKDMQWVGNLCLTPTAQYSEDAEGYPVVFVEYYLQEWDEPT